MNIFVKFIFSVVVGGTIGLVSANEAINSDRKIFSTRQGPWVSWPMAGTRSANPYVKAHFLTSGRLPASQFEVNEFEARHDDAGNLLDARCSYIITGKAPNARWWSIYTYADYPDNDGKWQKNTGLSSQHLVYEADDTYTIHLTSEPVAGNRLSPAKGSGLTLIMRHYNPERAITSQYDAKILPSIKREKCR